ncbi:hypothetical protein MF271_04995 [Deinococcus sp. KNUC1210]|uniref:hypothetical protein n=1 Tax=Deinococcus sp. KNUC1210 TaxID=2917691 RepID=UPI001EF09D90|nr:hypothetical protein [Deinococcus sp. KNUC1210]ULH15992.1 hypothetical protein MF271_04995 [Deinococcus sp. KNUC1210]
MLNHRKQPELWGCLYHALFALMGDEELLDHARDLSNARFYARLAAMGAMPITLFASLQQLAESSFWELITTTEPQQLLVSIAAARLTGMQHLVAVEISRSVVIISDSRRDQLQYRSFEDFLAGPYAVAFRVEALAPSKINLYPFEDAEQTVGRVLARDRPDLGEFTM